MNSPRMDYDKIKELVENGYTAQQIAKELGVSDNGVYNACRTMKIKPRRAAYVYRDTRKASTARQVDDVNTLRLYKQGKTIKEIADELGLSKNCIYRKFKRLGLELDPKNMVRTGYVKNSNGNKKNANQGLKGDYKLAMKALKVIYDNAPIETKRREYIVNQLKEYAKAYEKMFKEKIDPFGIVYVPVWNERKKLNEYVAKHA